MGGDLLPGSGQWQAATAQPLPQQLQAFMAQLGGGQMPGSPPWPQVPAYPMPWVEKPFPSPGVSPGRHIPTGADLQAQWQQFLATGHLPYHKITRLQQWLQALGLTPPPGMIPGIPGGPGWRRGLDKEDLAPDQHWRQALIAWLMQQQPRF